MQIAAGAIWKENADGRVGIEVVPGHSMFLNEVGSVIWKGLAESQNESQLLSRLLSEFDVPMETAASDLKRFIDLLEENLILER